MKKTNIIYVYALTNILATSKSKKLKEFYGDFKSGTEKLKKNLWFISRNFESKSEKNKSITQAGLNKKCQNMNGLVLENFMLGYNLFASNTASKKIKDENHLIGSLERQNNLQNNRLHLNASRTEKVSHRQ